MNLDLLKSRNIKYAVYDAKTLKQKTDNIKLEKEKLFSLLSIFYFLLGRVRDELVELDIKLGENKHFLCYPYKEEILAVYVTKSSDYVFVKQNIKSVLKG